METIVTRECSPAELQPDIRELIKGHLQSDDALLFCCETKHEGTPFINEPNFYGQVVTQRGIVQAIRNKYHEVDEVSGGMFYDMGRASAVKQLAKQHGGGKSVASMLHGDIVSVEESTLKKECYIVKVVGHGESNLKFVFGSRELSVKFLNTLRTATESIKSTPAQPQKNAAERLRDLTKLYEDGLISEVEFQQKRRQILDQI